MPNPNMFNSNREDTKINLLDLREHVCAILIVRRRRKDKKKRELKKLIAPGDVEVHFSVHV